MPVNEGMANLSDVLFWTSMVVYAVGMLGYAAEFAFSRLGRAAGPATAEGAAAKDGAAGSVEAAGPASAVTKQAVLVGAASTGGGSDVLTPGSSGDSRPGLKAGGALDGADGGSLSRRRGAADEDPAASRLSTWIGRIAVVLTIVGWAAHVGSVVTRAIAAGRVPWGNMYEFSSMICLIAVTGFLVLMARQPVRWLGVFVMVPVVLSMGFAWMILYVPVGPLVPALNSYWLKIHVAGAIVASGVFLLSAVTTVLFLLKDRWETRLAEVASGRAEASRAMRSRGGIVMRLPSSAALDTITYRIIAFAFPIWTFAIIAGAIWAEAAWGRYWGWDPKETWSFITWVIYAAYLHARATAGWRGRRAAAVSLLAFSALFVDYYLVNLVINGLHSYAGV
ncbi:cytochrome c-type biogenesis protein CcsB [Parafrankia irregularis]|uniref:Cytochrome c-type biogenesis protein CcsB n=1 Tax=Parafrankia irregularis TaxID=795642 RepID=A0A0S4QFQ4_9ACTN|nr:MULTISPECIES: c-type cytochrome biogenesis protein CcsB [Parafrankia]MBE3203130.1 c-type cytochrome biogenesis protein CcsB [Parafrankia sp. CH37]CUU54231.1 cytochrome c-type biogenesis protein CcsB [Parafrankia irregularis]